MSAEESEDGAQSESGRAQIQQQAGQVVQN